MNTLNYDTLETLVDYTTQHPGAGIFPAHALLNKEWLAAWRRKLAHAAAYIDANTLLVRKGHTLTWTTPANRYCRINSGPTFDGINFLLKTHPAELNNAHRLASSDTLLLAKDAHLTVLLLDGNVLLDNSIRLVPALGYVYPAWQTVDNLADINYDNEEAVEVVLKDSGQTRLLTANYWPNWDFEWQFVAAGNLVQSDHDLSAVESAIFRDMYTALLTRDVIFPTHLKVRQIAVQRAN